MKNMTMMQHLLFKTYRRILTMMVLLTLSAQAILAQTISANDIKETLDIADRKVVYTLSDTNIPEGSTITWSVDNKVVTSGLSDGGRTVTLQLSNKTRKAKVTVSSQNTESQTLSFDITPKTYGEDYDGQHFYADTYHAYADGTQGDGSKEKPYLISTDLELAKLAHDVTNGSSEQMYSGKYFKLGHDISLDKGLWMPIGTWSTRTRHFFAGKFNGDGFTISNMRINWTVDDKYEASWGLFARLYGKSADAAGYASVTNLIIEKASVEKKPDYKPSGSGTVKIGVVAGDLTDNAEIGNIIIRQSKVTDNQETYNTAGKYRVGGIVGYLDGKRYKIYNITASTEVNMLKNAQVNNDVTISAGIGCASTFRTDNAILPTNIYVNGPALVTGSSNRIRRGGVLTFYNGTYKFADANQQKTLYYAPELKMTGNNVDNYGSAQETADFGNTFVNQCNTFVSDNVLDGKMWAFFSNTNTFSFSSFVLKLERGDSDVLTVVDINGQPSADAYDWYVSYDNINWEKQNTESCPSLTLPRQNYSQYVFATLPDGSSRTNVTLVKAIQVTAIIDTDSQPGTYIVKVSNDTQVSNEDLGLTVDYHWFNGETPLTEYDGKDTFTRPSSASESDIYNCHVIVKYGDLTLLDQWFSATKVVYLNPSDTQAISETQRMQDDSWGYSPEKPMRTWKGAYTKLSPNASWNENYIVLMGTSSVDVTNDKTTGFSIVPTYQSENNVLFTMDDWTNYVAKSPLRRNATITGKWNNHDYEGVIEISGANAGLPLWGDTRFQHLTFNKSAGGQYYNIIYCQYHNLEMGDSIKMTGYNRVLPGYGTIDGAVTNAFHIFGGFNNDARFYPLNTKEKIEQYEKSMPHGRDGFKITIKSGFYSCICAGGRQIGDDNLVSRLNGVMGTPNLPIKCTIDVDIDRKWNDKKNDLRKLTDGTTRKNDYDIGIVLAGNHEGAMYADVDINIKSGTVARVVNGTLGSQHKSTLTYPADGTGTSYPLPDNTYMGRANIVLDPTASVNNDDTDVDGRVVVTELYGGSTGRGQAENTTINNPFYGYSSINIKGGTFRILPDDNKEKANIKAGIYGAGAGGMNGIGYGEADDATLTPDKCIPYWNEDKTVMLYGPYDKAKDNLVKYHCYNANDNTYTDVDPMDTNTKIVIDGGKFGLLGESIDGIYACGSGYMSDGLWTTKVAKPNTCGGNVYGKKGQTVATLTINGGEFFCKNGVFAGGRGTDYYYSKNAYKGTATDYTDLGKTYGNVEMNINGGIFHCSVYGGGYGVADVKSLDTGQYATLSNMARIYGKTTVNIHGGTFYENIYGGGDMAVVDYDGSDYATNVNVSDKADIRASVFAAGNGRPYGDPSASTDNQKFTRNPDQVGRVNGNTNLSFYGDTNSSPSVYGDVFGGGNLGQVSGDTHVNIYAGNFAGEIFGGGKGQLNADNTVNTSADVMGNTYVLLDRDEGIQETSEADSKNEDNFSINVIWNKLWDGNQFIGWDESAGADVIDKTKFYADGKFLKSHNIFGGGNVACRVGTYDTVDGVDTLRANTGLATVIVRKGMTPYSLLKTSEWKASYDDDENPHFYVFGGGYGADTKVGSTDVTVDVEGDYGIYDAEVGDDDEQLSNKFNFFTPANGKKQKKVSKRKASAGTIGSAQASYSARSPQYTGEAMRDSLPVFDNSKGIPNFTVLGVLGGGYSGVVTNNTKVTVDGNTFLHRVYGGGFGYPLSTVDNETGSVGGNTEVHVQGAYTYGDVFGGGAGVAPKNDVYFTGVARVLGTTKVEVSDDAHVYGNVYGGGDMANVGVYTADKPSDYYNPDKLKSVSTFNQTTGAYLSYAASGYKSFVNLTGGDIFGQVFGGGKGLRKEAAVQYNKVGRINGNTLVHMVNTNAFSTYTYDHEGNNVPYVWNRIYGGCAYGTVDGNTLVHIEGGMLGLNVFGGGFGHVIIDGDAEGEDYGESSSMEVLEQVLGRKDTDNEGTYADVLGNTKVQMDGGAWIWDRKADSQGNIVTWLAAQADGEKVCENLDEFKAMVASIKSANTIDDVKNEKARAALERIQNDKSTKEFFQLTEDSFKSGSFKKNHNIFGGGNRACRVGTYTDDGKVKPGTGTAVVEINHSPLSDLTDANGKTLSLLDITTLQGFCFYLGSKNISHPQFSVFGAGYGANTKVGNTKVYAQPGAMVKQNGELYQIDGKYFRYPLQETDRLTYTDFETNLFMDFMKVPKLDKKLYYGSVDGTENDPNTFRRYYISRMAWSLGIPGFTLMEVHGGGFSGYVADSTYVEANNQLTCNNIYGAGLGAKPYSTLSEKDAQGNGYDFGSVDGNSKVFIKSGNVSQNVYGGGAGIESVRVSGDEEVDLNAKSGVMVDFPDMARVKGKTEVHIYGERVGVPPMLVDRTLILGNVYGGGDVANVGTDRAEPEEVTHEAYVSGFKNRTTTVNIRGGVICSQVFAGGKGRTKSECADYRKLGGVYGNACFIADMPMMSYPYCDTDAETGTNYDPSAGSNLKHPNDSISMPSFLNRVYGGCQNGTVYGNTILSVNGGYFGHNIFGGGYGNCDTLTVDNQTTVTTTSADVTGNTNVFISGGEMLLTSYWLEDKRFWEPASILGDKTYSPQYNPNTRKFKINHNIYAGGNTACVVGDSLATNPGGNTYLTMVKGMLYDYTQVRPGQTADQKFFDSMEWEEVYDKVGSPHFCVFGGGFGENTTILGNTNVNITMMKRGSVKDFDIVAGQEYRHFLSGTSVMDIVGGGYSGKVVGDTYITGNGGVFCRRVFGGGFYNSVNATHVNLNAIDTHDIFGGGLMGDVLKSTTVNIGTETTSSAESTNSDIYVRGSVYGGNDVSGYVNVSLDKNGYFKDNGGTGTHVNIYGGHIFGNVYGAGNGDYLYALDKKGNTKVTVNEAYPLNPNDPDSETEPLVYTVPMRDNMPSYKAASNAAKIVNINSWRPMTNKVDINIKGNSATDTVLISGAVYGGGNSATVQKVQRANVRSNTTTGWIKVNLGSHVNISEVFMGCNGDALFTASEDNDFMNKFQKLNGDVNDYSKELDFAEKIDWLTDPSNRDISTLYLSTKNEDRPLVYPYLLDLYFQPVETDIQGELTWNGTRDANGNYADDMGNLTNCVIGTFCCGGNRGNMNVYPKTEADYAEGDTDKKVGNVLEYTFPEGLTVTDKIVGGCNNANYDYKGKVEHEGGYLLGLAHSDYPFIKLNVECQFRPEENDSAYIGGNVYGGCYKTGTVRGDIRIDLLSDMLAGKSRKKLDMSNQLIATNPEYSSLNVYGGGYGMESYVYGNTNIRVADGVECLVPATSTTFNPTGTSANFIYGGGQQGNVIGVTNVEVFNGHVYKSVTGGSYSGYVWGSTQVKVGYPKYYKVNLHESGRYLLKRADQKNKDIDKDRNVASETIKQHINLITDDMISQAVYDDIVSKYDSLNHCNDTITAANKSRYFTLYPASTPKVGWNKVNIKIGEAVYGGGYSLAQGSSVMANNTTVLKFTDKYNLDNAFTTNAAHIAERDSLPGSTTAGFGGNTTILIGDRVAQAADGEDRDHITISHQEMKSVTLPAGTDLYGYYYKHQDGNYHFISLQDKYFFGENYAKPEKQSETDKNFYEYDSDGGIFGDGHLSYAQGFRSADLTGYGFAETNISNPKIINTFQRMDILRLEDNCFTVLGARDYATNATNKTPYSIARVGEIQMFASDNIVTGANGQLKGYDDLRSRNYMGLANNIHYVGALTSNVSFNDAANCPWHDGDGTLPTSGNFVGKSYQEVKQSYIDDYQSGENKDNVSIFQKRNDGTAKNMIGIASGYALKIQNVQALWDSKKVNVVDSVFYGPVYGVVEMNLIDVRSDEGGGYVYADNVHKRDNGDHSDFLQTTGNFVFPYTAEEGRFIVDDCFPSGFYALNGKDPDTTEDVHYWYVTGFNYYYNAHITGYTYQDALAFNSDNSDGLTVLAGLKAKQKVTILHWKMRSGHSADEKDYTCDLEHRNYLAKGTKDNVDVDGKDVSGKYSLYIGASSSKNFNDSKGFVAKLPMNATGDYEVSQYLRQQLPDDLTEDAKITFQLRDSVNNSTSDYFTKHLAQKCQATLVLKAPAYESYESETENKPLVSKALTTVFFVSDGKDGYKSVADSTKLSAGTQYYIRNGVAEEYSAVHNDSIYVKSGDDYKKVAQSSVVAGRTYYCSVPRFYTYTIYLTIEYVQGPNIEGKITVENCALPGEMIRIKKDKVVIKADQSFSVNGYYWRIGKREKDGNKWVFEDKTDWQTETTANGYDTYKQGDTDGTGVFEGCHYDQTEDYLDIPAYYYMNGYAVQLGVTMNGLTRIFPVEMTDGDTLTIHNYHRMDPQRSGINLQLAKAIARAHAYQQYLAASTSADGGSQPATKAPSPFAAPRIYLSSQSDLNAFTQFVDSIGTGRMGGKVIDGKEYVKLGSKNYEVPRYGANAEFVLQNDLTLGNADYDGTTLADFAGKLHGNGHVIHGLAGNHCLVNAVSGDIYNLGLSSGSISNMTATDGKIKNYHCCFEYAKADNETTQSVVYRMDGTADTHYTKDDFRLGRVAYDLNEYYLRARYSNKTSEDKQALQYLYDYYANGDYQYAHRSDLITGRVTGVTFLRTGKDSDLPNYEQAATRHDQSHTVDKARATTITLADGTTRVVYEPLFDANHQEGATTRMNDFLFWGQSLQSTPADYPTTIGYQQYTDKVYAHRLDYMTNRVYRTAGYYGNTQLGLFHYNAYTRSGSNMDTYVHIPTTTAIDFTCQNDEAKAIGMTDTGIFYPPVGDNATSFSDFNVKDGVSQNLLVYTAANSTGEDNDTEAYDVVNKALGYGETTKESFIKGHHVVAGADGFAATNLHLVERTPDGKNSDGDRCDNNDFCVPIPFHVSNRAWYVRQPQNYANDNTGAWEGICLPFTVQKAVAQINGEITHFYGTASDDEKNNPAINVHTLHHEYWLRGLMAVNDDKATFQRPGIEDGLFNPVDGEGKALSSVVPYDFNTPFFVNTYSDMLYNKADNPYYATSHTYEDYPLLTSGVPYVVRFPGERYYEFDLSSKFYNNILNRSAAAQTITFNAYGHDVSGTDVTVPVTTSMATTADGYAHCGTFAALEVKAGSVYGMNDKGTAFDDASSVATVMPFRTYMGLAEQQNRSRGMNSVIYIAEQKDADRILPALRGSDDETSVGDYLKVRPVGQHRVRIESTQAQSLNVYTTTGQLYRVLDVQPGTSLYSGFQPGIYIFGTAKVLVR